MTMKEFEYHGGLALVPIGFVLLVIIVAAFC